MSSHLNRAGQVAVPADACLAGSPIGYDGYGQIVVRCRNEAQAPLVQEILVWCIMTSAIFVLIKLFSRMR